MKSFTKILSLFLALTLMLSFPVAASATELEDAPIDESRTGSLTIYKYDLTNAEKDGVWDSSYVSTGVFDQTGVNDVLGGSGAALGNGETGYGYAIKGVEFSYLKVADIVTFSESENDSRTDSHVEVLYVIDKAKGADFLKALNLADGKNRYTNADALDSTKYYYQSDVLIDALAAALECGDLPKEYRCFLRHLWCGCSGPDSERSPVCGYHQGQRRPAQYAPEALGA